MLSYINHQYILWLIVVDVGFGVVHGSFLSASKSFLMTLIFLEPSLLKDVQSLFMPVWTVTEENQ